MDNVFTTIVTFNGAATIKKTLQACHRTAAQHGPIFILDNASKDDTLGIIHSMKLSRVWISRQTKNIGVAAAYNLALNEARRIGARWLFILDQDSQCDSNCLEILLSGVDLVETYHSSIGALCPTVINSKFPAVVHYPLRWERSRLEPINVEVSDKKPRQIVPVDSSITSGTLYSVKALTAVQGFCEKYFIDFVDHECHMRLRKKGFDLFWIPSARIHHYLGLHQIVTPQGLWIEHPPYRYYYMVRNMLEGYKRLAGLRALMFFILDAIQHYRRIWHYGQAPVVTLKYILKGALHAGFRKFGALDER
jgi:rhamnosyltransferase